MRNPEPTGTSAWSRLQPIKLRHWMVGVLMSVIALMEWQRTDAMAKAHRERQELSIEMAEMSRKVDWLLLVQPPTSSALALRPAAGSGRGTR